MNRLFVNVKVDREERPDVDSIYMQAVQAMTGHGGWPMTVFLAPDGRPFFGGTYFPKDDRPGMTGFVRLLEARRPGVARSAPSVASRPTSSGTAIGRMLDLGSGGGPAEAATPRRPRSSTSVAGVAAPSSTAASAGSAAHPSSRQSMTLDFLLRTYVRDPRPARARRW